MNSEKSSLKRTLTTRELVIGGVGLFILLGAIVFLIFAVARARSNNNTADVAPTFPSDVVQPATVDGQEAPEFVASPVIAPTIAPTPVRLQHPVQPGETPSNIALLYNVELQALLDENNLTADSFIQTGQILTIPLPPGATPVLHTVAPGDTLATISAQYNVAITALQAANNLANADNVIQGQELRIPGIYQDLAETAEEEPSTDGEPVVVEEGSATRPSIAGIEGQRPLQSGWDRSNLNSELEQNYPLVREEARYTVHYQPDTYTSENIDAVVTLADEALSISEERLGVTLEGTFDLYLAGTLYAAPNAHLRGVSRSADRNVFLLVDGSGDPGENLYLFTHEITHMVAWNTYGAPSSTLLSEGVATYAGQVALEENGYTSYDQLCTAAYEAGETPSLTQIERDWQSYQGHIRNYFNYFSSGCFVSWLIDTYGLEPISQLYSSSDYVGLYGETLAGLDSLWRDDLEARLDTLTLDSGTLTQYSAETAQAYAYVLGSFNDTDTLFQAYIAVDQARLALWRADFEQTGFWLDEVYAITGFSPGAAFAR